MSTSRLEEEQIGGGGGAAAAKQLEKRRRLEEEALQKVQHLLCWACGSFNVVDCRCAELILTSLIMFVKIGFNNSV